MKTITRQAAEIQQLTDTLQNTETKLNEHVQRTEELLSEKEKCQQQISKLSKTLEVETKWKQSIQTQYEELAKTKAGMEVTAQRQLCEWEVCVFMFYRNCCCPFIYCVFIYLIQFYICIC